MLMPIFHDGARDAERLVDRDPDPLRQVHGAVVGQPDAQHAELITTEARDDVTGANARRDAPGHRTEQLVTGDVPEVVVDRLEPVEVAVEDGAHAQVRGEPS